MPSQDWIEANRANGDIADKSGHRLLLRRSRDRSRSGIIPGRRALPPIPARWLFA